MRRGTTPTIYCYVKGADLTGKTIYATIKQGDTEITLVDPYCEKTETGCTVSFRLTQEETLSLPVGRAEIQLRWINNQGRAAATCIKTFNINSILKEGEIEYA